jgi:protein-S-isoprenylcysteine O-methyltransferase Ste14
MWGALLYSLSLTGLGYQNGWTPFYYWLRKRKLPRREFKPRGAYKLIRHPVYFSFLGLVWLTPRMSLDHAVLTAIWTTYLFYGSFLKDRRLEFFIGDSYRKYQAKVPGYPLMPWGPLARHGVRTTPGHVLLSPDEPVSRPPSQAAA